MGGVSGVLPRQVIHAAPLASAALLMWACVSAFPHPALRAHAGVSFALHWTVFLLSTLEQRYAFRVGDWAQGAAACGALLSVAVGLARGGGLVAAADSTAAWAGKCLVASAMVSVWVVVRAVLSVD